MKEEERKDETGGMPGTPQTPPEIPEELKLEKEWADRLGINYDEQDVARQQEEAAKRQEKAEQRREEAEQQRAERPQDRIYVMPADRPLPPAIPREPMPPTFMLWAVLSTICCCLPAGVVAIVFAAQVGSRYYARNYEGARKASRLAEIWIIVSIVLGIVSNALYLPFSLLSGGFQM